MMPLLKRIDYTLIFKELILLFILCFIPLQALILFNNQPIYVFSFFIMIGVSTPNVLLYPYITGFSVLSSILVATPSMLFFYRHQKRMISSTRFEPLFAIILTVLMIIIIPRPWITRHVIPELGDPLLIVPQLAILIFFAFIIMPIGLRIVTNKISLLINYMTGFEDIEDFEKRTLKLVIIIAIFIVITFFVPSNLIIQWRFDYADQIITFVSIFDFISLTEYSISYSIFDPIQLSVMLLIFLFNIIYAKRVIEYICNEINRNAVIRMGILSIAWAIFSFSLITLLFDKSIGSVSLLIPLPIQFVFGLAILKLHLPILEKLPEVLATVDEVEDESSEDRIVVVPIHYILLSRLKIKLGRAKSQFSEIA